MEKVIMQILFENPQSLIIGKERRSKLLDTGSELYKYLDQLRSYLERIYPYLTERRIDFHVELIKKGEPCSKQLLDSRSMEYHGTDIDIDITNCVKYGRAIAIQCPDAFGHCNLHISIAYFKREVPNNIMYNIHTWFHQQDLPN